MNNLIWRLPCPNSVVSISAHIFDRRPFSGKRRSDRCPPRSCRQLSRRPAEEFPKFLAAAPAREWGSAPALTAPTRGTQLERPGVYAHACPAPIMGNGFENLLGDPGAESLA